MLLIAAPMVVGAFARSADWTLTKATGSVSVTGAIAGPQPIAAKAGMTVAVGQTVVTGSYSRAMLVHGNDIVAVGPSTNLTVPQAQGGNAATVLAQTSGTIDLDIEKLAKPHFIVETPYLTATVKGTHFTVRVGANYASVTVSEGRVEVTDHATGQIVALLAGQSAATDGTRGGLQVTGSPLPMQPGSPLRVPSEGTVRTAARNSSVGNTLEDAITSATAIDDGSNAIANGAESTANGITSSVDDALSGVLGLGR
jgi:hypothetical protein